MKTNKYNFLKGAITILLFLGASQLVQAQEGANQFTFGPEIGWATSNPLNEMEGNKGWGLGLGGSFQFSHFFTDHLAGGIEAGIISYTGRSAGPMFKNKAYTVIPIRIAGNFFLGNLHLGAQIGAGFNSTAGSHFTTFSYSPQVGYNFERKGVPLDLTLHYDGYAGHDGFGALMLRLSLVL